MSDIKVSVSLTLDDSMSAEASKALRDLVAAADKTGKASKGVGDAARTAGKAAGAAGREGAAGTAKYLQGLRGVTAQSKAAATATRAQAAQTREAAKAYEASASAARQAARAQKDLSEAVRRTDGTSLSRLSRTMDAIAGKGRAMRSVFGSFAKNAAMGVAQGVGQRAHAAFQGVSLQPSIDYERRLAMMANTAFADRKDMAGRQAGMQEIRAAVDAAVTSGGGKREATAEALDSMIASGAVGISEAMGMLPTVQKFATATGAAPNEIAGIAIRGIQQGFFKPEQVEEALNSALVAGQEGGFELKDMARWLPQLMASAQGMKSMEGFKTILAAAQASVTTAGDTDQAGNNLVNLLAKLNSRQLSDALKNKNNINLSGTLAAAREKGQLPLEAFISLLDKEVVGKSKQYKALQARAANATGGEKEQIYADMGDIVQSSAIGEVLADRQATMALVALMNDPGYIKRIKEAMSTSAGAVDTNFDLVQSTFSAKQEQAGHARDAAMQSTFDKLSPALHLMADGVTAAANAFPAVTTAATAAAAALGSLAALAGVGYLMRGRAGASRAASGPAGRSVKARRYKHGATPSSAATPSAKLSAGAKGRIGGAAGIAVLGAMDIATTENDDSLTREEKNVSHAENVGGAAGALALGAAGAIGGAKVGAIAGTAIGGPIGTAVGGLIGAIAGLIGSFGGHYLGSLLGKTAGEAAFGDPAQGAAAHGRGLEGAAQGAALASGGGMSQVFPSMALPGAQTGPDKMTLLDLSKLNLPTPQVTNHIKVNVDGREVLSALEERIEFLRSRGD